MIFDQQALFFDKAISGGNVVANVGGGDAHDPLFLVVVATTGLDAVGTLKLETSDAEGFSGATVLGTYSLPKSAKGMLLATKVPFGAKKFLRLTLTGASSGALTAGLTANVPNWNL